jgi:hypothetical protein
LFSSTYKGFPYPAQYTKSNSSTKRIFGGQYVCVCFSVEKCLQDQLRRITLFSISKPVQFLIKIDGIPLVKSNTSSFWPLLGLIKGEITPFPIGVFHGMSKPDDIDEYFTPFIRKWISSWQTVAST